MYTWVEERDGPKYFRQDPSTFAPEALDCDQWIRTASEAGMRYAVLTCKHHEGFCLWPSEFGDYSTKQSSWRDGQGDVVKDFTDACHKYGLKVGIYYSPYDSATPLYENDPKGYDDYFIGHMRELLGNYGTVDMLWFDGCHSESHVYDWDRIATEIHALAPGALIFNMGRPDFRWIGNEYGVATLPTWNIVDKLSFSVQKSLDVDTLDDAMWLPAECDCRMRLHSWGWNPDDEDTVKSVDELMGLYQYSVGRGCNLLLNIGPNRDGLLPEKDAERLLEFGREIHRRYGHPLAALSDAERVGDTWTVAFQDRILVDHVVLQEDIRLGEHIRAFEIQMPVPGEHFPPVVLYKGENVGHKALCSFPPVAAHTLIIKVTKADGEVTMRNLEIHCACQNQ
jgi:alpha-L-fucosidase